jgi:hypothetical protein
VLEPKSFANTLRVNAGVLSIAIWIVVLLGLVEKVNNNQTSDFWGTAGMNSL